MNHRMRFNRFAPFVLALSIALIARPAHAIVVFMKGNDTPLMGFYVRQNETTLTIQVPLANGLRQERVLVKSEIDDFLLTVESERLEKLDPDDPQGYRNYAEELTEKRQDPEARETSIRLYLIAAHLDRDGLGRSSMLGLINLARHADEESRFRAMAYLLDPEHDARVLVRPDPVKRKPNSIDSATRLGMLNAVGSLRRGRKASARDALRPPEVRQGFEFFAELITLKEFEDAVSAEELSPTILRKLILLELALLPSAGELEQPTIETDTHSWLEAIRRDGSQPVPILALERLTEFDPHHCFFRNGKWGSTDE